LAFFLIWKEESLKNFKGGDEIFDTMFGGRYIIFLMGLFSIYTGFIYNDLFAKSISLGPSGWSTTSVTPTAESFLAEPDQELVLIAPGQGATNFRFPYVFGVDPIWQVSENKLTYSNSYKMKLSVILGIIHMEFGVILGFFNHRFFKDKLKLFHMFIPQILFLSCIFLYLAIMIIYKWCTPIHEFPNKNPPSLLLMLINMFLKFGSPPDQGEVLYGDPNGNTQKSIQMILVVVAVLCVPWMLLVRPLILRQRLKKQAQVGFHNIDDDEPLEDHGEGGGGHGDEHSFGEIMVHQAIHTIEFCLGCISNTASYLRLWALSLAHAQLSDVLWTMVLRNGFSDPVLLYFAFAIWAGLTVAVLLIMEGLSAFLHALRLHWVEFQNKFYEGNGVLFRPFAFSRILKSTDEEF
jgi:V-type H+-transporting ATPase subunit a